MALKNTLSNILTYLGRTIVFAFVFFINVLPGWIRCGDIDPSRKPRSIRHLNGLRGYAALAVFSRYYFPWDKYWAFNLPFVNIFKAGAAMAMVFYVISGYVLSHGLLQAARSREYNIFLERLVSSSFRRYFRLFVPLFVATFIAMMLVTTLGWMTPRAPSYPKRLSLPAQIYDWILDCRRLGNPLFVTGHYQKPSLNTANSYYLYTLWTIPIEFCGSMVVFAYCAASCRMSYRTRMIFCSLLILICYVWTALFAAAFLMGAFLAELSLERTLRNTGLGLTSGRSQAQSTAGTLRKRRKGLYFLCYILALFLLSRNNGPFPKGQRDEPFPWPLLNRLTPSAYRDSDLDSGFYPSFGAFLLVLSLDAFPALRRPLEWSFSQYLGDISFGVFATQLLAVTVNEKLLRRPLHNIFGNNPERLVFQYLLCWPILFWMAELFAKFDARFVRATKWLEGKLFVA